MVGIRHASCLVASLVWFIFYMNWDLETSRRQQMPADINTSVDYLDEMSLP